MGIFFNELIQLYIIHFNGSLKFQVIAWKWCYLDHFLFFFFFFVSFKSELELAAWSGGSKQLSLVIP